MNFCLPVLVIWKKFHNFNLDITCHATLPMGTGNSLVMEILPFIICYICCFARLNFGNKKGVGVLPEEGMPAIVALFL